MQVDTDSPPYTDALMSPAVLSPDTEGLERVGFASDSGDDTDPDMPALEFPSSVTTQTHDYDVDCPDMPSLKCLEPTTTSQDGPRTENGAPCLACTGSANLDLFSQPYEFFDGEHPVADASVTDLLVKLSTAIELAYNEDPVLAIYTVLQKGNIRQGGVKNHTAYLLALVFLYETHPKTFVSSVAPFIAVNSCPRDLLTLLAVITPNRTFPLERIYCGEQPDCARGVKREYLHDQESKLWKSLLVEFGNLKSSDVVKMEPRFKKPRMEGSPQTVSSPSDSCPMSLDTLDSPPLLERDGTKTVNVVKKPNKLKRCSEFDTMERVKTKTKNVWLNDSFKARWQEERGKLHSRDYGSVTGSPDTGYYKALVDFVVEFFTAGILAGDRLVCKWAPTPHAAHDKATKGVTVLGLPASWGVSGGISQAIAYNLYGTQVKTHLPVEEQKRFVMTKYKKALSTSRTTWVPESLTGRSETAKNTPDLSTVTSRWMSHVAPLVMTTPKQKSDLTTFIDRAANGEAGCTITSGAARPHLLFRDACTPAPGVSAKGFDYDSIDDGDMNADGSVVQSPVGENIKRLAAEYETWERERKVAVLQWESMQAAVTKAMKNKDVEMLAVVDVSGSMAGTPMEVAIALGVLLSHANDVNSPYYRVVFPFDVECTPIKLDAGCEDGADRWEKPAALCEQIKGIPWGFSTRLESVFDQMAILERSRHYDMVGCEDPPIPIKQLVVVIISDMGFDDAMGASSTGENGVGGLLKSDVLEKMYTDAGLGGPLHPVPTIVYWNVRSPSNTPFPAGVDTEKVVLLSGDSDGPFQALLSADFSNVTRMAFMRQALSKLPFEITETMVVD
ncbi:hypothetical protein T484DRAFT_1755881 [Baffinella frigidus]|nr:hypothetical protein T484DRAFT_1755881 [Cryptophyta sp. CCMP2293]